MVVGVGGLVVEWGWAEMLVEIEIFIVRMVSSARKAFDIPPPHPHLLNTSKANST